jgi:hypothetical protein
MGGTVTAKVQNDGWIGQEPSWDGPVNRRSRRSKGASLREPVHVPQQVSATPAE